MRLLRTLRGLDDFNQGFLLGMAVAYGVVLVAIVATAVLQ